jgi:hypothetical protein
MGDLFTRKGQKRSEENSLSGFSETMRLSWLACRGGTAPAPTDQDQERKNKLFAEMTHRTEGDSQSAAWGSVSEELELWDEEGVRDDNP